MKFYEKNRLFSTACSLYNLFGWVFNLAPESSDNSESAKPKSIKKLYEREVIQFAEDNGYEFERSDTSDIASDSGETLGALTGVRISGVVSGKKKMKQPQVYRQVIKRVFMAVT